WHRGARRLPGDRGRRLQASLPFTGVRRTRARFGPPILRCSRGTYYNWLQWRRWKTLLVNLMQGTHDMERVPGLPHPVGFRASGRNGGTWTVTVGEGAFQ